jgi:hypothetical protein
VKNKKGQRQYKKASFSANKQHPHELEGIAFLVRAISSEHKTIKKSMTQ